jgi:DNA repair exonuclease SbcCD ATPase subunit
MINFKSVRWKNFLSTGNNFTEIQLNRNPTTLIIGENGAGKSTILDALCFGLFGKPFRVISKSQLVNSINGGSTMVEIEFSIASKNYKVIRGIKPNKFEIYLNDNMLNQEASVRDYQKILEQQILKLNYRSFTQVVILGSSTFVPFMQLKSTHRREVVEEILDIQIFSIMNLLLKQNIKTLQDEIKEVDYNFNLITEKINLQENHIDDLKKNKDKIIEQKINSINTNKKEITNKTNERNKVTTESDNLLKSISDKSDIETKKTELQNYQTTIKEKHKTHSKTMKFFEKYTECPTCKQEIEKSFKEKMIKEKKEAIDKLKDGLDKLEIENNKLETRFSEIVNASETIRKNQVKLAELNASINQLEKFNVKLQVEIDSFNTNSVSDSDIEKLTELKNNSDSIEVQRKSLKEEKSYSDAARAILQDTGIKTKVIKQYLPIMNKLINKYLNSMDFYVNFTLDENFTETIKSRHRDEFNYASFSEGEKMRIDLALLFTWRAIAKMKNSVNTNLLILDEIFDSSLDGAGTDEFLKILNTLEDENVFVISHKQDTLVDKFRSTIKFEKVRNFSHVIT